jgi:hypothetical protein
MNNTIQRILDWCKLAGIPQNGDDKQFNLWIDLMEEELKETIAATKDNNPEGILDGLADLIWVTCNWAHMNNLDLISMLEKVDKSNYSKFCTSTVEAVATVDAYRNGTHWDKMGVQIECDYKKVGDYFIIKRNDGKILKSLNYKPVNKI